jgi:hypothetical protein
MNHQFDFRFIPQSDQPVVHDCDRFFSIFSRRITLRLIGKAQPHSIGFRASLLAQFKASDESLAAMASISTKAEGQGRWVPAILLDDPPTQSGPVAIH